MTRPSPRRSSLCPIARRCAVTCFIVVSTAPGLNGCGHAPAPKTAATAREPVRVSVTTPLRRELPRFVRTTGTLFGDEETTIAAKVSGRIVETTVDLGDSAKPGDVLARVEPTDYELARDEREQAFREVLASIGLTELPGDDFSIDSLPTVERARLQAENAQARHDRGKVLADRQPPLISAQDFADLRTAWEVAESNLRVERLSAEATLAEARTLRAQVNLAEQRVRDAVHRAPGDANAASRVYEVADRFVSMGDFVQMGTPLFRLVDGDPLKLRAAVPERRLGSVKVNQTVSLHVESRTDAFEGVVSRVSPAVDPLSRSFIVEIVIPNANGLLKPGSFAVAEILVTREPAIVVPENTIITFAGVHKVVAVVDSKAVEKRVELGQRQDGMVEILSGLADTDSIIVRPPGSLTTGSTVTVVAAAPDAPAPAAPSTEGRGS